MCFPAIFLFILSLMNVYVTGLSYSELNTLGPSCSPRDTCASYNINHSDNQTDWENRNCFCDPLCSKYGDCCIDSSFLKPQEEYQSFQNYHCISMKIYGNLYMKGTCMSGWEDQGIAEECYIASPSNFFPRTDPMRDMPVTSKNSRITYMNRFCAICNNDTTSLEFWKPRIECSEEMENYNSKFGNITLQYVYDNLVEENGTWGMYLDSAFNGNPEFSSCAIDPQRPANVEDMIRNCKCTVDRLDEKKCIRPWSTCSQIWDNDDVENLCQSYTAIIYDQNNTAYRNIHCAQCNNVSTDILQCDNYEYLSIENRGRKQLTDYNFNPRAFTVLFDFLDFSGSNIVGSVCDKNEIWDPFFKQCRNIVCGKKNHEYKFGKCFPIGDLNTPVNTESSPTPDIPVTTVKTKTTAGTIRNVDIIFPGEPIFSTGPGEVTTISSVTENPDKNVAQNFDCDRIHLSKEEYKIYVNETVYVESYGILYNKSEYEIHSDGILICTNNFTLGIDKFTPIMGYVTLIGLIISCIGILLHLVAFFVIPGLRNLSEKNLASLCFALLGAYVGFILGLFGEAETTECSIIAVVMYYFFLSSFCWMNILSFDIQRTLQKATSKQRVSQGGQWPRFIFYSLYGWLVPFAASGIVVIIDTAEPEGIPADWLPALGQKLCWFGHRNAILVFFAAPLGLLMGINIIFFIFSANRGLQSTDRGQFKLLIRLTLLMGLTWISGIVAGYLQMKSVWYVSILLNTLQGLFICLAFTDLKKLWSAIPSISCSRRTFSPRQSSVLDNRSHSLSTQNLQLSESTSMVTEI